MSNVLHQKARRRIATGVVGTFLTVILCVLAYHWQDFVQFCLLAPSSISIVVRMHYSLSGSSLPAAIFTLRHDFKNIFISCIMV